MAFLKIEDMELGLLIQVTNPLGGAKHKLFCVYLTLGKLPPFIKGIDQ